jgi:hypothetical protein
MMSLGGLGRRVVRVAEIAQLIRDVRDVGGAQLDRVLVVAV